MQNLINLIHASIVESNAYLADMPEPCDDSTPEYEQGHLHTMEFIRDKLEHLDLTDTIKNAIRAFVGENYGDPELDNPSWDIDLLATAINNKIKGSEK